jgi:hypothetical protein
MIEKKREYKFFLFFVNNSRIHPEERENEKNFLDHRALIENERVTKMLT